MEKIAWIGTGVMGHAMVSHLIKAGYPVQVYNRSIQKTEGLNAKVCLSIEDVVKDVDIVFTMLGYPKDVEEVYAEIFKHQNTKPLCIDMTTSAPDLAKQLALRASELGIEVLDAPVSGGDIGAKNASLAIMVGGSENTYRKALPLFEKMGKTITYCGTSGNGQHCKMANQIVVAGNVAAVAESMSYAIKQGLDPKLVLQAISGGAAGSWQLTNNGPKMIDHDDKPGFYIHHFVKDLLLVLSEAENVGLELPIVSEVLSSYQALVDKGYASKGTQALIEHYLD
ncbi:MAG TPA: oxidoreductase [Erysipelotrichaceae bacterium]|nr:oxidoreductase [Erysipelotrichaceae bacterium]